MRPSKVSVFGPWSARLLAEKNDRKKSQSIYKGGQPMNRKIRTVFAILVVLSLLLSSCRPAPTPAPIEVPPTAAPATEVPPTPVPPTPVPPTPVPPTPVPPKMLEVALLSHPNVLDPCFASGRESQAFLCNIYDSLTAHSPEGGLEPALAVSWKALDEKTWQFRLRQGVKFHNGEPFNAQCVKVSLDRILDPENASPMHGRVGKIDHVEVVDDYTVNLAMKNPDVTLPARLSELYGSIVPAKYVQEVGNEGFAKAPVGTGPFKFVEWVKDERLVLEANRDYWRGAPQIDKLTIYPIVEDAARMAALQTGEVDIAAGVPAFLVEELRATGKLNIVNVPSTRFFFIVMRTDQPPFNDVRVRQAVNYALNVPALIQAIHYGYGTQVAAAVISQAFGYDDTIKPYPYDVKKAKDLLAEAGYPDGFDTTFDAFTGSIVDHSKLAEAIVGQLAEVGIRCELNVAEFGVFKPTALKNETNPLYIYSFGEWAFDADNTFGLLLQAASGYYYDDPEVLDLFAKQRGAFDPAEREKLLKELQQKFYDESPYGYLYQIDTIWGMQKNVLYEPRIDELTWLYTADIRQD